MASRERCPAYLRSTNWHDRRVTIFGLGREGESLARYLAGQGARVLVTDRQSEPALAKYVAGLAGLPVAFALGGHPDSALEAELIFVSPGIPQELPILQEANRRGIPLTSETDLLLCRCSAPVVGITGSSGKTTTTTLVGHILERSGFTTWVGGNIGQPLMGRLDAMRPNDRVVLEMSSFQLEHLRQSPNLASILNITPNHLDRHGSMDVYIEAKRQIYVHQDAGDRVVLGYDDPVTRQMAETYRAERGEAGLTLFRAAGAVERGAYLLDERIILAGPGGETEVCSTGEIRLRGQHNVLNVLAACAIAAEAGATPAAMREEVTTFTGVEHRIEPVRTLGGVLYVNDSIATSPERSMAALRAYVEPIVLLAGGRDKHLPWDDWADLVCRRARQVIAFGEAAGLIERAIGEALRRAGAAGGLSPAGLHHTESMEQAVGLAARLAQAGDVVLLSPGGTSFDAYVDFAQRGERFKELVRAL